MEKAKGSTIDVYGVHSAIVIDTEASYQAKSNDFITSSASIKRETSVNPYSGWFNGTKKEHIVSEGDSKITVEGRDISGKQVGKMAGKYYNDVTDTLYDHGSMANAPYMSCSWMEVTAEGASFYQCHKGKWSIEGKEAATKKDGGIDPKNVTLVYEACETIYEYDLNATGFKEYDADADDWTLVSAGTTRPLKMLRKDVNKADIDSVFNTWFNAVQLPTSASASALELSSSSPIDGATDVDAAANLVLTFNNVIVKYSAILLEGSMVIDFNYSKDTTNKIFTNIHADLTAGTEYMLTYDVKDEFGQTLKGAITFSTAT